MRKVLMALLLIAAAEALPAAPAAGSVEKSILDKNGMVSGFVWNQMPAVAKYAYIAGFFGATFSLSDWTETIASERSSPDIEQVAVMQLGITKGRDVSVKWLSDQLDAFYAKPSNASVQVSDATLAILKRDANKQ